MERKRAIAIAVAATAVVVSGAIAIGANVGILGARGGEPAGKLAPVDATVPQPARTIVVNVDDTPRATVAREAGSTGGGSTEVVTEVVRQPAPASVHATASHEPETEHEGLDD